MEIGASKDGFGAYSVNCEGIYAAGDTKGVTFRYPLVLLVNMIEQSLAAIAVPKGLSHVLAHEERLALLVCHGSDLAEHFVLENLNISFHKFEFLARRRSDSLAIYSRTSSSLQLIVKQ